MNSQTFQQFAQAVRDYLEQEWPEAWADAIASDTGRREVVRVTLGHFMRGSTVPVAAGAVAVALALRS